MNAQPAVNRMLEMLSNDDYEFARRAVYRGDDARLWKPDLVISPDGAEDAYLYRWYIVGSSDDGSLAKVMLHIQTKDDPERPFHDHPWDNMGVIIAGSHVETLQREPPRGPVETVMRRPGDVVHRRATEAHRLTLPHGVPYCMTIFSTGPRVRDWGFWYGHEWHSWSRHVTMKNGISVHREDAA